MHGVCAMPMYSSRREIKNHGLLLGETKRKFYTRSEELTHPAHSLLIMTDIVRALFSLLLNRLSSLKRETVLLSAELLGKLALSSENTIALETGPEELYHKLVELLCVTAIGTDPFEIATRNGALTASNAGSGALTDIIGISGVEESRIPACCGSFVEFVDVEMRDCVLETIYQICMSSEKAVARFMQTSSCKQLTF